MSVYLILLKCLKCAKEFIETCLHNEIFPKILLNVKYVLSFQEPPPAALDFLDKIREIISSAKTKMRTRTFQPSLNDIPEDDYTYYTQSRPHSRSTATAGRLSRVSFKRGVSSQNEVEDLTNRQRMEYENVVSSDPQVGADESFTVDSLDGTSDGGSRASTLKRIAKRVNERGTSLVSEIIRTLDKKNKDSLRSYHSRHQSHRITPDGSFYSNRNSIAKVSAVDLKQYNTDSVSISDDRHSELIKPSLLRSILKDGKDKSDGSSNTFENLCQEMVATFNRIKKYGESKTPVTTLGRRKKLITPPTEGRVQVSPENGDGKVRQWLEGLDKEGLYTDGVIEAAGQQLIVKSEALEKVVISPSMNSLIHSNNLSNTKIEHRIEHGIPEFLNTGANDLKCTAAIENEITENPKIIKVHENTYEEIKLPKNRNIKIDNDYRNCDQEASECSDSDSLDSQTLQTSDDELSHKCNNITSRRKKNPSLIKEFQDDLNTSFDPDTLEKPPKRRVARSRSVIKEKNSDYCYTTESEDIYEGIGRVSTQSINESNAAIICESERNFIDQHIYGTLTCKDVKPPLPPKQCVSPENKSVSPPARPPKISESPPDLPSRRPPLPAKTSKVLSKSNISNDPPVLPSKIKCNYKAPEHFTDNQIPELSDEAAATILLGLQARNSPLSKSLTNSKISNEIDKQLYESGNLHRNETNRSSRSSLIMVKKSTPSSKSDNIFSVQNDCVQPVEERVRGQFILAPEGKSPLSMRSSLSRSGRGSISRSSSADTDGSNKNVKLCQCAKTELEKHFIEKDKTNADTVKKTWRRVIKKTDDATNNGMEKKSIVTSINEEQEKPEECLKCTKQKQEDSGYQSSDSCGSEKSKDSTFYESSCSIDLEGADEPLPDEPSLTNRRSGFGPQIFQKSLSLQHLQDASVPDAYRNFDGSQCSSRSSHSATSIVSVAVGNGV